MELTHFTFIALLTGLPLALFAVYDAYEREGRRSWGAVIGIIVLVMVIMMAFYGFILEPEKNVSIKVLGSGAPYLLNLLFVFVTSPLPVLAYWNHIRYVDAVKEEPLHILLLTTALGLVAAIVVVLLGKPLFLGGFASELTHGFKESLDIGFLDLAVPAELTKWLFLLVFLRMNRYYDEYIDGVVYSVCLSMGFTVILSTWFICDFIDYSFPVFLKKGFATAFLLIPIHFMSGVLMGYFIALARKKNKVLNMLGALIAAILLDGTVCTILTMIGGRFIHHVLIAICLSVLACVLYNRINYLLHLDAISEKPSCQN